MKISVYQGRFPVGKIKDNCKKIIKASEDAVAQGIDLIVFPECAVSGYAAQDLLFQEDFRNAVKAAIDVLTARLPKNIWVIVGAPVYEHKKIVNALLVFHEGELQHIYAKRALPNHDIFDERRYFRPGNEPGIIKIKGVKVGLLVCFDFWKAEIVERLSKKLDLLVVINASPFFIGKREQRVATAKEVVAKTRAAFLYVHQIGGQDEIIFDGGSFVLNKAGELIGVLPQFTEVQASLEVSAAKINLAGAWQNNFVLGDVEQLYQALILGVREYVSKNNFDGVLVGLSGGIDSAVTLALLVHALGAQNVEAVLMPSRFTQEMSLQDAKMEAKKLGVKMHEVSIETLFTTFLNEVSGHFENKAWDLTEENIQARLRGMILMALSNKEGKMVVSTTNKSELAVGYGTLYGDLAGGFALLKDVYKTEVYRLAAFINREAEIIPERVITRAPSAELREGQTDQDSLPAYEILDAIVRFYVEENLGQASIVAQGFTPLDVHRVIYLINASEYKRQQAPLGPKVSKRAFGKDWRVPITKGWECGHAVDS